MFGRRSSTRLVLIPAAAILATLAGCDHSENFRQSLKAGWEYAYIDAEPERTGDIDDIAVGTHEAEATGWRPARPGSDLPADEKNRRVFLLRTVLPLSEIPRAALYFDRVRDLLEVRLNGRTVHRYGTYDPLRDYSLLPNWPVVPLAPGYGGGELLLICYGGHDHPLGISGGVYLGDRDRLQADFIRGDLDKLVLGVFFLSLSILAGAFVVIRRERLLVLPFAALCLISGLYTFLSSVVAAYLGVHQPYVPVAFIAFLIPAGIFAFFDDVFGRGSPRPWRRAWQIHSLIALGLIGWRIFDGQWYIPYDTVMLPEIALMVVMVVFYAIRGKFEARFLMVAMTGMLVCGLNDLLFLGLDLIKDSRQLFHFGMLGFVLTLAWLIIARYLEARRRLEHLAMDLENKVGERTRELHESLRQIDRDLDVARNVQKRILPINDRSFDGLSYHYEYQPLDRVGGDFFDIDEIRPGLVRLVLADAVGHGVQASLITMGIHSEWEELKGTYPDPASILMELNQRVRWKYGSLIIYMPCFCADIDLENERIVFASAGHPSQLLLNGSTDWLEPTGPYLGLTGLIEITNGEMPFSREAVLLLFSDGLSESLAANGAQFGDKRIAEVVGSNTRRPVEEITGELLKAETSFREDHPRQDDVTVLAIRRTAGS